MPGELLSYLIAMCICIIGSWIGQMKKVADSKDFGYMGFIPFINIIVAICYVIAGFIMMAKYIINLPERLARSKK